MLHRYQATICQAVLLKMLKDAVVLLIVAVSSVKCFTPTCEPDNPFRFFCFGVDACSESFVTEGCRFDKCGFYDAEFTTMVKIYDTSILPRCAFINSPGLRHIYGVDKKIEILSTKTFVNLPNLIGIHLGLNLIREVRRDVFRNVSATFLDLSYNRIIYIEKDAFVNLPNLKVLNISRNEIVNLPIITMAPSINQLVASYNFMFRSLFNSRRHANLTSIDLSYNQLEKIAISFDYNLQAIDLTRNLLQQFDFIDIWSVDEVKIPFNLFTVLPEYLVQLNAKKLQLYPNPWRCDELQKVWSVLERNNIQLSNYGISESDRNNPICFALNKTASFAPERIYAALKTQAIKKRGKVCNDDRDCGDNFSCRAGLCWDPCVIDLCDDSSDCKAVDHRFVCTCPKGTVRNITDIYSPCHKQECFFSTQCPGGRFCVDGKCDTCDTCNIPVTPDPFIPSTVPPTKLPWWYYEIPVLKSPIPP